MIVVIKITQSLDNEINFLFLKGFSIKKYDKVEIDNKKIINNILLNKSPSSKFKYLEKANMG